MAMSDISIKDPKIQKLIGGVVLLIIIIAVWYTQFYGPNKAIIEEKRDVYEQASLKLSKVKLSASKLPEIRKEMEKAFLRYKILEELLPVERDVPNYLNRLNMAARENNINVKRIDVDATEPMGFYSADPYRIELTCNYHDFGGFLEHLANMPFIVTCKNVGIDENTSGRGSVSITLTIISYHLPNKDRLQNPLDVASTPTATGTEGEGNKPRATESDAATALSGGMIPPTQ